MPFPNLNGRPSEYTDEAPNTVYKYIEERLAAKMPVSRAGAAVYIGISKQTLLKWADEHQQLLDALKILDSIQESDVQDRGLLGEYNSNIAKLILANHGYSDKQDIKSENTNTNLNVPVDNPEQKLQEILSKIKELQQE